MQVLPKLLLLELCLLRNLNRIREQLELAVRHMEIVTATVIVTVNLTLLDRTAVPVEQDLSRPGQTTDLALRARRTKLHQVSTCVHPRLGNSVDDHLVLSMAIKDSRHSPRCPTLRNTLQALLEPGTVMVRSDRRHLRHLGLGIRIRHMVYQRDRQIGEQ